LFFCLFFWELNSFQAFMIELPESAACVKLVCEAAALHSLGRDGMLLLRIQPRRYPDC
jgi:hypothetical protein